MEVSPYSIYIDKRPLRIAFLVNPEADLKWFDQIFKFNQEKWGGRFNPIILTDGKTIEDREWIFLREYDPDIIPSLVPLDNELRKKIHIFLSPFKLEFNDPKRECISIHDNPISILPTRRNAARVSWSFGDYESSLVLFKFSEGTSELIKSFITRNFGFLEDTQWTQYNTRKALDECKKQIYEISDLESLNEVLSQLGEFHNRIVYPMQICSIPNTFKDPEYNYDYENFAIIIGNSPQDLAYFWNRALMIQSWMRKDITQLWLPQELAEEEKIRPGLEKFLNRYISSTGNENSHGAHFVTFSLDEDEIKEISNTFTGRLRFPKKETKFTDPQIPKYGQKPPFFLKRGLELCRAHSNEEHIVLADPDVQEGVIAGQYWCADLFIQFRPERFTYTNVDYWWQLPRRNHLLYGFRMFNKLSRINSSGMFSILMQRRSSMSPDENVLVIKLPKDDMSIFRSLICGERYDYFESDDRSRFLSSPFYYVQRSDKGMYLSGILSISPNLYNAHSLFEKRYWRRMFEIMSNQGLEKDKRRRTAIFNTLKKAIQRGRDFNNTEEDINWLAEKVLQLAKTHIKQEIDLSYKRFLTEAEEEHEQFIQKEKKDDILFSEDDLKESLSELVGWNVLLPGIKPKCPRCGYRIWYHIDETKKEIICKGCNYTFSISVEQTWYYKLNSLVHAGFSLHGTIPVLLVLGQLLSDVRTSFMHIPSLDLFTKEDDEVKLSGELDIVCIKDGQFIIGEIKQTVGLFDASDFEKIASIAELLKPDLIIFSSLDKEPNRFVSQKIEELQQRLKALEIGVKWYPINDRVFDPSPVY